MTAHATLLDGKAVAKKRLENLVAQSRALQNKSASLCLATLQVGDSKDASLYSRAITNLFQQAGITHRTKTLPESAQTNEICHEIKRLNADEAVTGILVFSPLPKHADAQQVLEAIDITKDAEGRRILNTAGDRVAPPTALACMALVEETGHVLEGAHAVVIGRSDVVGKPVAMLLIERRATVTVCNSKTVNLATIVKQADIVIATAGQPRLVKGDWIKKDAVVIDVGENVVDGKLVGDVEFEEAKNHASYITPVPGGVGPLTNVMLLKNLMTLYRWKEKARGNS